eukprot:1625774-Amphidinium_carterae.1
MLVLTVSVSSVSEEFDTGFQQQPHKSSIMDRNRSTQCVGGRGDRSNVHRSLHKAIEYSCCKLTVL